MKYTIYILIFILAACNPQKRLHRLVTKHPEIVKQDTILIKPKITVSGTVKTKTVEIDTTIWDLWLPEVKGKPQADKKILDYEKDSLRIIVVRKPENKLQVYARQGSQEISYKKDTIPVIVQPIGKTIINQGKLQPFYKYGFYILGTIVFLFIIAIIIKIIK